VGHNRNTFHFVRPGVSSHPGSVRIADESKKGRP